MPLGGWGMGVGVGCFEREEKSNNTIETSPLLFSTSIRKGHFRGGKGSSAKGTVTNCKQRE